MRKGKSYFHIFRNESFYYIFIVTVAYFLTYVYVRGKQGYYHIPPEFTPIDSSLLLEAGIPVIVSCILLLIVLGANYFYDDTDPSNHLVKQFLYLVVINQFVVDPSDSEELTFLFLLVLMGWLMQAFVFPILIILFTSKKKKQRLQPLIWSLVINELAQMKKLNKRPNFPPTYKLIKYEPKIHFLIIYYLYALRRIHRWSRVFITQFYYPEIRRILKITLIIIFLSGFCSNLGQYSAENEDTYRFIELDQSLYVILGSYKDSYIVAPCNLDKKVIKPHFRLVNLKEVKSLTLYTERVGHLTVKEPELPIKYNNEQNTNQ